MADSSIQDEVERVSRLAPQQAKFFFLKLIDPTMTDAEAARRSGYKHGSASAIVKSQIQGILGEHLAERGITMDTIAEKLQQCLHAKKFAPRNERTYDEKGRPVSDKAVKVDLGPDYMAILRAAQTLIVLASKAEKEQLPELPAPKPVVMSKEAAEALTGRGPQVVEDADYEEIDVQAG